MTIDSDPADPTRPDRDLAGPDPWRCGAPTACAGSVGRVDHGRLTARWWCCSYPEAGTSCPSVLSRIARLRAPSGATRWVWRASAQVDSASYHHFQVPYLVDTTAFDTVFGPFPVTPHEQAVTATVAWFRAASRA